MLISNLKSVEWITAVGSFFVTITVITTGLNEPANAPKMFILASVAFFILGSSLKLLRQEIAGSESSVMINIFLAVLAAFVAQFFIANLFSAQPFEHGFYGTYGRNTGTLTYLSLSIFLLISFLLAKNDKFAKVLTAFFLAGLFNLIYFAFTLFNIEIFNWNNPSKSILGTFGNSNFTGAFMGIFLLLLFARALMAKGDNRLILLYTSLILFTAFEIYKTRATQGIIVSGLGFLIFGFFYIRSKSNKIGQTVYLTCSFLAALVAVLGMLQIGPLSKWLYKTSVSLRGGYWNAGWEMGLSNPVLGVGPDSYGFYYRKYRGQEVIELAGPGTTTDAAHNVFLDILAYGGFPLLILYVFLQIFVLYSILRVMKRSSKFDPIFSVLVACWFAYQAQSFISINQIGVAIWGWILSGIIIGLGFQSSEKNFKFENKNERSKDQAVQKNKSSSDYSVLIGSVFGFIGLIVSIQPLLSDGAYVAALKKREIGAIELSAKKWPTNPVRLGDAATIFSNNGFQEQSLFLARYSIEKYPDSYVSWFVYYSTPGISETEKAKALRVLKKLDPLNKDLGKASS